MLASQWVCEHAGAVSVQAAESSHRSCQCSPSPHVAWQVVYQQDHGCCSPVGRSDTAAGFFSLVQINATWPCIGHEAVMQQAAFWTYLLHDGLKHEFVALIVHALLEGDVDRVVSASAEANITHSACAWEEVSVLVEADRHHAVCQVESLLYAIPMMNINIHIQDPARTSRVKHGLWVPPPRSIALRDSP